MNIVVGASSQVEDSHNTYVGPIRCITWRKSCPQRNTDDMDGKEDEAWRRIKNTLLETPKHEVPAPSMLPSFLTQCGIITPPSKKEIDEESVKLVKELRKRFKIISKRSRKGPPKI